MRKFRKSFPAAKLNDEYRMTLDEFLDRFEYLAQAIEDVDDAARKDYQLASFFLRKDARSIPLAGCMPRSQFCC
jgi:hypothetical protein